jgi:hypothetical protein
VQRKQLKTLAIIGLFFLCLLSFPAYVQFRRSAGISSHGNDCTRALRHLGMMVVAYAVQNGDRLPPDYETVRAAYPDSNLRRLYCPYGRHSGKKGLYLYLATERDLSDVKEDVPLFVDYPDNHRRRGYCMVYIDIQAYRNFTRGRFDTGRMDGIDEIVQLKRLETGGVESLIRERGLEDQLEDNNLRLYQW